VCRGDSPEKKKIVIGNVAENLDLKIIVVGDVERPQSIVFGVLIIVKLHDFRREVFTVEIHGGDFVLKNLSHDGVHGICHSNYLPVQEIDRGFDCLMRGRVSCVSLIVLGLEVTELCQSVIVGTCVYFDRVLNVREKFVVLGSVLKRILFSVSFNLLDDLHGFSCSFETHESLKRGGTESWIDSELNFWQSELFVISVFERSQMNSFLEYVRYIVLLCLSWLWEVICLESGLRKHALGQSFELGRDFLRATIEMVHREGLTCIFVPLFSKYAIVFHGCLDRRKQAKKIEQHHEDEDNLKELKDLKGQLSLTCVVVGVRV